MKFKDELSRTKIKAVLWMAGFSIIIIAAAYVMIPIINKGG